MLLKEALDQKLLRLVPQQETSYFPEPYKNVKRWEDWRNHIDEDMTLVNIKKKFVYLSKAEISQLSDRGKSLKSKTIFFEEKHKAIVYLGDKTANEVDYRIRENDFIAVTLTKELLNQNIANISTLNIGVTTLTTALRKILQGKVSTLTTEELVGVLCYPTTYEICSETTLRNVIDNIVNRVKDDNIYRVLNELLNHSTERSRLLLWERGQGVEKPEALKLFKEQIIKQGRVFK